MEARALISKAFLTSAELFEISSGLWNILIVEDKVDTASLILCFSQLDDSEGQSRENSKLRMKLWWEHTVVHVERKLLEV